MVRKNKYDIDDDAETASYGDAHLLVTVLRNAAMGIVRGAIVLGVLSALGGIYLAMQGGFGNLFPGLMLVAFGVLNAAAGYTASVMVKGMAALLEATAEGAEASVKTAGLMETAVKLLEAKT